MKIKKIKIKNKVIETKVCNTPWKKFRGLMFRKNPGPLLFEFGKPTRASIHSLFCKPFRALWLLDGKVIDDKLVKLWKLRIRPKSKFDQLVEIPL